MDPARPQQMFGTPVPYQQFSAGMARPAGMLNAQMGTPLAFRPGQNVGVSPGMVGMQQMQYAPTPLAGRPGMPLRPQYGMAGVGTPRPPPGGPVRPGPRPPMGPGVKPAYPQQRMPPQGYAPMGMPYAQGRPPQQMPPGHLPGPRFEDPSMDFSKPRTLKRPTDRRIPVEVTTLIPEAKTYQQLVEFEKRLDINISKKKFDIQDALGKPMRQKRTLRIFVSNQAHDQPWQTEAEGIDLNKMLDMDSGIPSWTLRIEGRLLEVPGQGKKTGAPEPKFTSFVKSIVVEIQRDQSLYAESSFVEWRKDQLSMAGQHGANLADGFEIRRKGDEPVDVRILIVPDYNPERFKVNPALARILSINGPETRAGLVNKLWQYIKMQKLLDTEDKRMINLDTELQQVFGVRGLLFPQIPEHLNRHLTPLDPIEIKYQVRVDVDKHLSKTAWDVEVEIDDPIKSRMVPLANGGPQGPQRLKEIASLDAKIVEVCRDLDASRLKRNFMLAFASDPAGFTNRWVESQSEDLKLMLGDGRFNPEDIRRSDFFEKPEVEEAVVHYLNARMGGTVASYRK
ncbi:hypothetical protein DFJ74DRAFT_649611 [Hyaloraphidium curvatum]|nr:hypothetical protein DFJ74DRAFT_649611 [Hyaloraphidium curvatum]